MLDKNSWNHLKMLPTIYSLIYNWPFGIIVRVFASGPRDQVSIPGWAIPKTQKEKKKKGTWWLLA